MAKNRYRRGRQGADTARYVAFDERAPANERRDAQAELQKAAMPTASDMISISNMAPVLEFIKQQAEEQEMAKAMRKMAPQPSMAALARKPGVQSVVLDDIQLNAMGDFYDKPAVFGFDAMRQMVDQTPVLSAVIMTRINQIRRFCSLQPDGKKPGFRIALKEASAKPGEDEKLSMKLLGQFMVNGGWESKPRLRRKLRRDDFATFMAKQVRDSLTMDSAPIEVEWKRDRRLGIDGIYAIDGSTIRLCSEDGYRGDDEVTALQLVQGNIRTLYTDDDLIYIPRNPRTNVLVGNYGLSETELLVRTVTGFLNAFTYNTKFFDSNAIPKGMLTLMGNYSDQDLNSFKRQWNGMVKGINNAWALPVMVSKDQESKAEFTQFGEAANEIMFVKWMTFLASLICAIYGIAPDEINFESFTAGTSSLSGSDTEEKIINSKDKGLRPLLSHFSNVYTDYVIAEFDDKYKFEWTGLDEEDATQLFERQKLTLTVNEMRARDDLPPIDGKWGDAPLNPSLLGAWQAENQPQEDYGDPSQAGQPGEPQGPAGGDFGQEGEGADFGQDSAAPGQVPPTEQDEEPMGKALAFGLPIYKVEP